MNCRTVVIKEMCNRSAIHCTQSSISHLKLQISIPNRGYTLVGVGPPSGQPGGDSVTLSESPPVPVSNVLTPVREGQRLRAQDMLMAQLASWRHIPYFKVGLTVLSKVGETKDHLDIKK